MFFSPAYQNTQGLSLDRHIIFSQLACFQTSGFRDKERKWKTPTSTTLITITISTTFRGLEDEWSHVSFHVFPGRFTRMKFTRPRQRRQDQFRAMLNLVPLLIPQFGGFQLSSKSRAAHELLCHLKYSWNFQ